MFKKRDAEVTILAKGTKFEGNLSVAGDVHVHGQMEGSLASTGQVWVAPSGEMVGALSSCQGLSVEGTVAATATVHGHVQIAEGGALRGELAYHSVEIRRGGVLEGRSLLLASPEIESGVHEDGVEHVDVDAPLLEDSYQEEPLNRGVSLASQPPPLPAAEEDKSFVGDSVEDSAKQESEEAVTKEAVSAVTVTSQAA